MLTTRYSRQVWRVVICWRLITADRFDESSHVDDSLQQQWLMSRHKLTTRPGYNFSQNILFSYLSPFIYPYLCTLVYIQNHYHSLTHTYIYILLSFQLLHLSYSIYILTKFNFSNGKVISFPRMGMSFPI